MRGVRTGLRNDEPDARRLFTLVDEKQATGIGIGEFPCAADDELLQPRHIFFSGK